MFTFKVVLHFPFGKQVSVLRKRELQLPADTLLLSICSGETSSHYTSCFNGKGLDSAQTLYGSLPGPARASELSVHEPGELKSYYTDEYMSTNSLWCPVVHRPEIKTRLQCPEALLYTLEILILLYNLRGRKLFLGCLHYNNSIDPLFPSSGLLISTYKHFLIPELHIKEAEKLMVAEIIMDNIIGPLRGGRATSRFLHPPISAPPQGGEFLLDKGLRLLQPLDTPIPCLYSLLLTVGDNEASALIAGLFINPSIGMFSQPFKGRECLIDRITDGIIPAQRMRDDKFEFLFRYLIQVLPREHPSVSYNNYLSYTEASLHITNHFRYGALIGGVAGEDIMTKRQALFGHYQPQSDLVAFGMMIPAIPMIPYLLYILRIDTSLRGKIAGGDIIEEDLYPIIKKGEEFIGNAALKAFFLINKPVHGAQGMVVDKLFMRHTREICPSKPLPYSQFTLWITKPIYHQTLDIFNHIKLNSTIAEVMFKDAGEANLLPQKEEQEDISCILPILENRLLYLLSGHLRKTAQESRGVFLDKLLVGSKMGNDLGANNLPRTDRAHQLNKPEGFPFSFLCRYPEEHGNYIIAYN